MDWWIDGLLRFLKYYSQKMTGLANGAAASWSAAVLCCFSHARPTDAKAAEDCRTPRPRGNTHGATTIEATVFVETVRERKAILNLAGA
jgi:hypothetical protein